MTILAPLLPALLAAILACCLPIAAALGHTIATGTYAEAEDLA